VFLDLIFHNPDMGWISPSVTLWWPGEVVDLLNLVPADIWSCGNVPAGRCVDFIGACLARPEIDRGRMEVRNIPVPREWFTTGGEDGWYHRLLAEMRSREDPPILVNLLPPFEASRGARELCRLVWDSNRDTRRWVVAGPGEQRQAEPAAAPDLPSDYRHFTQSPGQSEGQRP
jgi:hypothetical protein